MAGKIFINYRRDDVPGDARGVRDALVTKFGRANVFMDIDNLFVGQRFDMELAKALDQCDMLIAVIGPRWLELLRSRIASGERDYVREEIAEALKRRIAVVPVRVGREGSMHALPRPDELPENIRDLVLYQKHDVAHERFRRDIAELIAAIRNARGASRVPRRLIATLAGIAVVAPAAVWVGAHYSGLAVSWPWSPTGVESKATEGATPAATVAEKADQERQSRQKEEAETAARKKADEEARAKAEAERTAREEAVRKELAEAKAKAEEAERQRVAMLAAEEEKKRKEAEEAARRAAAVPKPGETFRDCPECPEMVVVPAGEFMMGSGDVDNEKPPHKVTIGKPFAVGSYEVTFAEWDACVSAGGCNHNPSDQGWGRGQRPVINVSRYHAKEYAGWLSEKTGKAYYMLSEAEWEYAARAGTTTRYAFGDTITKQQV